MTEDIKKGSKVQANRDIPNKLIKKGDKGTVYIVENIDSELYLHIKMDDGGYISPSCENCWDLITPKS